MTKKTTVRWLDRRIGAPGPYLCLCLSEAAFDAAMRHLKITRIPPWISSPYADATSHHINSEHGVGTVVCLSGHDGRDPVEVAGLLVHEAVHVWQEWCDHYGETHPGREQEAYAVQAIAQELMADYARQIGARK